MKLTMGDKMVIIVAWWPGQISSSEVEDIGEDMGVSEAAMKQVGTLIAKRLAAQSPRRPDAATWNHTRECYFSIYTTDTEFMRVLKWAMNEVDRAGRAA